jgi:hypothetical protein
MATRYHDNIPDPASVAALEQAKKTGCLTTEGKKKFTEELEALQARRPARPKPNIIQPTETELSFGRCLEYVSEVIDTTNNRDIEQLALILRFCVEYLARESKERSHD